MRRLFPKIATIALLGIVFLLGGVGTASAGDQTAALTSNSKGVYMFAQNDVMYFSLDACKAASGGKDCKLINQQNVENLDSILGKKEVDYGPKELANLACNPFPSGIMSLGSDGTFAGCVAQGFYYLFYIPLSWVMIAGAFVFDAMLTLSIDTKFISQDFINTTWIVVRDFSNMLFIFILIYTGVQTILGIGDWKKTVFYVVIMALLINFSLFFTKVVIDAGNILSVGVYQAIAPEKTGLDKNLTNRPGGLPERNVSFALTRGFQPQSFIGETATMKEPLDATIIFIVAGVVSAFAGYIFFKAGILFSRRLVVFWGLMILSPFAFISMALPGKANQFQSWLDELIAQTFVAPVFLFFIYIIMQVVNSGILKNLVSPQSDGSITMFTFDKILLPVIAASLIIKALQEALKYAEGMAGSTGAEFSGLVAGAMGMATGGATTLAAGALRAGVGGYAARKLEGGTLKDGSWQHSLATGATKASFDVRNLAGEKSILGKTIGGKISKAGGAFGVDVGKGGGVGGVEKAEKDRIQAELKKAEAGKVGAFEEQGMRSRPDDVAAAIEKNIAEKSALSAEATAKLTSALEASTAAQKAHDESETGAAQKEAEKEYEDARQRAERDKGSAYEAESSKAAAEAKGKLSTATNTHASAPTAAVVKTTIDAVEKAKKAEKEAIKEANEARTITEKLSSEQATWAIEAENKSRNKTYAKEAEDAGRHSTAAKIRKGEKSGAKSVEEMIKEQAKKEVKEEEEKKKKESEP